MSLTLVVCLLMILSFNELFVANPALIFPCIFDLFVLLYFFTFGIASLNLLTHRKHTLILDFSVQTNRYIHFKYTMQLTNYCPIQSYHHANAMYYKNLFRESMTVLTATTSQHGPTYIFGTNEAIELVTVAYLSE